MDRSRQGPASPLHPCSCSGPPELGQQCLAQHLLLLGCEAGGELDVKEDEEVSLLAGVLRQWHPLTWHNLEVLRVDNVVDRDVEQPVIKSLHLHSAAGKGLEAGG